MDKEEIITIIMDRVPKEFGAERMKEIEYFGSYEGDDLDMIVYVKGIDEREDTLDESVRLFDMHYEMNLDVPFHITSAKSGMGEVEAA